MYENGKKVIYVGIDVHDETFTCCFYDPDDRQAQKGLRTVKISASAAQVRRCMADFCKNNPFNTPDLTFRCAYEACGYGYDLARSLHSSGIDCVLLAPSTIKEYHDPNRIKTDKHDAFTIAKSYANGEAHPVHIPDKHDEEVDNLIRIRDMYKDNAKRFKQQIIAMVKRMGYKYEEHGRYWTQKYMKWLADLPLSDLNRSMLDTLLNSLTQVSDTLADLNGQIDFIAESDKRYAENVQKLKGLFGIDTYTALATVVKTGDFKRFPRAKSYMAYLGLIPGEASSGNTIHRKGLTRKGNARLRQLLTESAQCYLRKPNLFKSSKFKNRQKNLPKEFVTYADRALIYIVRKGKKMLYHGKNWNTIVSALARVLAGFIWGVMTHHLDRNPQAAA
jgi:transposase